MSTFRRSPRMPGDELDPRQYPDVAPISDDVARMAKRAGLSELDEKHAAAMDRAKGIQDDVAPVLGAKDVPALYKIEIYFGPNRTLMGPNSCVIKFWESGRRLHGGGDDLMYMCRNRLRLSEGCGKLFGADLVQGPYAVCPGCHKTLIANNCVRSLVYKDERNEGGTDFRVETKKLAEVLAKYWYRLDGNADVYLKFDKTDIRYVAMEKEYGTKRARELKGLSIYPLKNILSDTANGASLEDRIFTFLTA